MGEAGRSRERRGGRGSVGDGYESLIGSDNFLDVSGVELVFI